MDVERFNTHWTPEPYSGCWLWTARTRHGGYGGAKHNGKTVIAHRLAWELYKGEIPQGTCVLHRCDTPSCVNPAHLFIGTLADNTRDMVAKGRANGCIGHSTKLSPVQVLEIRNKAGTLRALGREYGVDYRTIASIRKRRTWKQI